MRTEEKWLVDLLNDPKSGFSDLCNQLKHLQACGRQLATLRKGKYKTSLGKLRQQADGLVAGIGFNRIDATFTESAKRQAPVEYREFKNLENRISRRLEQYSSLPDLHFNILAGKWHGSESLHGKANQAIRHLVRLVIEGKLDRVRLCASRPCNRWFIARIRSQSCHNTKCRKFVESKNPVFKKRRARYMREKYRPQQRRAEAAARQLVTA